MYNLFLNYKLLALPYLSYHNTNKVLMPRLGKLGYERFQNFVNVKQPPIWNIDYAENNRQERNRKKNLSVVINFVMSKTHTTLM